MNTQIQTKPATLCTFVFMLPQEDQLPEPQIRISSEDYGFDCNEEEMARDLLAQLPECLTSQTKYDLDADEFEKQHLWFLS
ncbi:MAG: hypothetical protein FJZ87_03330 [Chloroflexi bacterium]|nr:hypothetical protein [Chloroflexota bacterium]